jgi:type IV pilus assembly protein PilC
MTNEIPAFKWSGLNQEGKRKSGVIQASGTKEAQSELNKQGIEIIEIAPYKMRLQPRKKKIKVKDIQLFTRYLSTMLSAGLPIIQALDIVSSDQANPALKSLLIAIKNEIASGKTLAETFSRWPEHFNSLYCNLIKAGEKSGVLDKILNRLATYLEKTEMIKRKIRKALIYPTAILSVAFIVSGILLIFVVPQFQKMFSSFGAELPFFTRIVVNLSNFVRGYWWIILAATILLVFGLRHLFKTSEDFKKKIDKLVLSIFIIGPVLRKGIIARFTRTLATTLEAGMPIVDSMQSMVPIMGSYLYAQAVTKMSSDLTSGHSLSVSMKNTELFPTMVTQMVSVGEASGKLPDMLTKIADYYEEEVNSVVDNLSSLLEPLIMLILGLIVGTFVVAMYLPIFKIGSLF